MLLYTADNMNSSSALMQHFAAVAKLAVNSVCHFCHSWWCFHY